MRSVGIYTCTPNDLLLRNSDCHIALEVLARVADIDGKVTRLDDVLHLAVPQTPVSNLEVDLDSGGLARLDGDLLEALELESGHVDRGEHILDVQLHNLGAVSLRLVGNVDRDGDGVGSGDVLLGHGNVGELELAVGETVAELVEGVGVLEDVVVTKDEGAVLVHLAGVGPGASRVEVVVVDGQGSDVVGEADGELSRGVHLAVEDIGKSVSALFGLVELLDESGGLLGDPGLGDGLAGTVDDNGGLARLDDGLDESGHGTDEVEVANVNVLASGGVEAGPELVLVAGPGSDNDNCDVGLFSGGNSLVEARVVVGPALAALSIGDFALASGLDTVKGCNATGWSSMDDIVSVLGWVSIVV